MFLGSFGLWVTMEEKSVETGKDPPPAAAPCSTEPHNGSSSMLTTSSMAAAAASLASVVVANGLPTTAVETTLAQPNSSFKKLDCTAATEEAAAGQAVARSVGDEEDLLPKKKRAKTSHEWVQTVLRQTAEMVMVLAGMGALRAGLSPTPLECKLATEAYEKLASLVENVAPLQLVSKDAVSSLIQQLRVDVAPQQPKTLKPFVIVSPIYCLPSLVFPFKDLNQFIVLCILHILWCVHVRRWRVCQPAYTQRVSFQRKSAL